MSNLSEEEIKDVIQNLRYDVIYAKNKVKYTKSEAEKICIAFMNCMDLYQKEKEKNEELEKDKNALVNNYDKVLRSFISKDVIKNEIKELENMKVDGEIFTTAVNFAKKEFQKLLEE